MVMGMKMGTEMRLGQEEQWLCSFWLQNSSCPQGPWLCLLSFPHKPDS